MKSLRSPGGDEIERQGCVLARLENSFEIRENANLGAVSNGYVKIVYLLT